jgi:ABC-type protease/lipase transport system fused ATPase/permease subunit
MNKLIMRGFWALFFLAICFFSYYFFGWVGVLGFIGAVVLCGAATIPINRKVREDERKTRLREG